MPLPRFRLRTLMLAVGAMAVCLAAGMFAMRTSRLAQAYRQKAAAFARAGERPTLLVEQVDSTDTKRVDELRRRADYATAMAVKYREAARRPWLNAPPDPPRPK